MSPMSGVRLSGHPSNRLAVTVHLPVLVRYCNQKVAEIRKGGHNASRRLHYDNH